MIIFALFLEIWMHVVLSAGILQVIDHVHL